MLKRTFRLKVDNVTEQLRVLFNDAAINATQCEW